MSKNLAVAKDYLEEIRIAAHEASRLTRDSSSEDAFDEIETMAQAALHELRTLPVSPLRRVQDWFLFWFQRRNPSWWIQINCGPALCLQFPTLEEAVKMAAEKQWGKQDYRLGKGRKNGRAINVDILVPTRFADGAKIDRPVGYAMVHKI